MLAKVKAWVVKHQLIAPGDRVLIACSGGPDSLALVHILNELAPLWQLELAVAHVDHMFRGAESAADAEFVENFCHQLGLACFRTAIDVPAYIKATGHSSPEDAARILRYNYLRTIADQLGGAKIATGHHRDDQAETVLLHLLRGAGGAGLRGILPQHNGIIRPLLSVSRQEIEEYCREKQLNPRFDSSNLSADYLRNRIRLELLPLIEQRYSAGIRENLARTARVIGDQYDFVRQEALRVWPKAACETANEILLSGERIAHVHPALRAEIMRLAIEKKHGKLTGITFQHVEKLLETAASGTVGSIIELPGGLYAVKTYTGLKFTTEREKKRGSPIAPPGICLAVPGTTLVAELGISVQAAFTTERARDKQVYTACFDWQQLSPPLYVRTRTEGDRFRPLGLAGTKKLKDFLIDAKVPRSERDRIPLVCDSQGIIWLAGYRQAERGRVTAATKQILQLTIVKQEAN